jgi:Tfp pilus assembly protein PilF
MKIHYYNPRKWRLASLMVILGAAAGCSQFDQLVAKRPAEMTAKKSEKPKSVGSPGLFGSRKQKEKTPDDLFAAARVIEKSGGLESALTAYDEVLKAKWEHGPTHHRLAIVHDQLGNAELAQDHFKMAIELIPDDLELQCDYSYCLYLRGDYVQANERLLALVKKSPEHPRAHMHLALVQAAQGDTDLALKTFATAGCKQSEAYANVAYVMTSQGKWSEAASKLQVAMAHDPKSEQIRSRFAEVQALQAANKIGPPESITKVSFHEEVQPLDVETLTARVTDLIEEAQP